MTPLDDVRQYGLAIGRRVDPAETRQRLARGQVVINGGFYGLYREQDFSGEFAGVDATTGSAESRDQRTIGNATADYARRGLIRRDAWAVVADGWLKSCTAAFASSSKSRASSAASIPSRQRPRRALPRHPSARRRRGV